jgi:dCMP deaminase
MDNRELLRAAYILSLNSSDPYTQNGAVLVEDGIPILGACIDYPFGVQKLAERLISPTKYDYLEHAERMVLFDAARCGVRTHGLKMVCPWACCQDCAKAIIQCGIEELVIHTDALIRTPPRWEKQTAIGHTILTEARVRITRIDGPIGGTGKVLLDGALWEP